MSLVSLALVVTLPAAAQHVDPMVAEHGERYIVRFSDAARGAQSLHGAGGHVALALPQLKAAAAYLSAGAAAALARAPGIAAIEIDPPRYPSAETVPYGITMVQAPQVSDAQAGNTTVCIIDSGYYAAHEDLQDTNVTSSTNAGTGNPLQDGCGHGSHVAGTIAALANTTGVVGVNPSGNVHLHIVKVFGDDCAWAYSSTLVAALQACRDAGARVVSMSLGGGTQNRTEETAFNDAYAAGVLSIAAAGNDGTTRYSYPASYSSVVSVAAIDAQKVAASFSQRNDQVELAAPGVGVLSTVPWRTTASLTVGGNTYAGGAIEFAATTGTQGVSGTVVDGGLCDATGSWSGAVVMCQRGVISFFDKVMNVQNSGGAAAVIYNNVAGGFSGTLGAGNSSTIPAISLSQEDGLAIVASSLGQNGVVLSFFEANASGYEAWDGTSMATPHVSGVAALVWSNVPTATNVNVRNALAATAEDLGTAGRDTTYGYGLVRARAALDYLLAGSTCTPTQSIETSCTDGVDNDCDGAIDAADPDCAGPTCNLGQKGAACTVGADCCSGKCTGKPGQKTCR